MINKKKEITNEEDVVVVFFNSWTYHKTDRLWSYKAKLCKFL